jgi:hypothetical protein
VDFSEALKKVWSGYRIRRSGWMGSSYVGLGRRDLGDGLLAPYLYMHTETIRMPWLAPSIDLLAVDWIIADGRA